MRADPGTPLYRRSEPGRSVYGCDFDRISDGNTPGGRGYVGQGNGARRRAGRFTPGLCHRAVADAFGDGSCHRLRLCQFRHRRRAVVSAIRGAHGPIFRGSRISSSGHAVIRRDGTGAGSNKHKSGYASAPALLAINSVCLLSICLYRDPDLELRRSFILMSLGSQAPVPRGRDAVFKRTVEPTLVPSSSLNLAGC